MSSQSSSEPSMTERHAAAPTRLPPPWASLATDAGATVLDA
ncbi:hypothetical protein [Arthrobacter gengyunqii]|nr:hypothetical protein [Arthrobacter gengyunqii]